jgi:hypothetical protein
MARNNAEGRFAGLGQSPQRHQKKVSVYSCFILLQLGSPPDSQASTRLLAWDRETFGGGMTSNGNTYRTRLRDPDWHKIAESAAEEKDPKKLAQLIQALCDRLEELQHARSQSPQR